MGGKNKKDFVVNCAPPCFDANLIDLLVLALDKEGRISFLNKKGYEILGWPEKTLEGQDWFTCCLSGNISKQVKKVFSKIINGELRNTEFYTNEIVTKDGQTRVLSWHNTLILDAHKKITGTFSVAEDITEHLAVEKALEESEEKYRTLVERSRDGVVIIDSEGYLRFVNEYLAKLLKTTVKEMIGSRFTKYIYKDGADDFTKVFRNFYSKKPKGSYVFEMVLKDLSGKQLVVENTLGPVKFNNQRAGLVIVRDASERRKNQKISEEKSEELKRINRLLVGRELRVIELKNELKALRQERP